MQHLSGLLAAGQEAPPPPGTELLKQDESSEAEEPASCVYCGGAGWLRRVVPLDDARFGRAVPCPGCTPAPVSYGVPDRLLTATFETFDLGKNRTMRPALDRCRKVATKQAWCALLMGAVGVGKSHLAAAALAASEHPHPGQFWAFGQLLLWLRQQMFDDRGPKRPEVEVIGFLQGNPALLVIDDLGAEKSTDWSQQVLYSILNARYESQLPTILTTNDAVSLDERILSRFYEGAVLCEGSDVRRMHDH